MLRYNRFGASVGFYTASDLALIQKFMDDDDDIPPPVKPLVSAPPVALLPPPASHDIPPQRTCPPFRSISDLAASSTLWEDHKIVLEFEPDEEFESNAAKQKADKDGKVPSRDGSLQVLNSDGTKSSLVLSKADVDHLKTIRYRDKYLLDHFNLDVKSTNVFDRLKILRLLSVSPNTFRGYSSHWNVLRANNFNLDLSDKGLCGFLATFRARYSNASMCHWISAVKLYMNAFGHPSLTEEERCRVFCKGYMKDNVNGLTKERGVINRDKLELLVSSTHCPPLYREGFQLQFACGLRTNQMPATHVDNFHPVSDKKTGKVAGYVYVCDKQKDSHSHLRKEVEYHICDVSFTDLITSMIAAARSRNGFLIPTWKQTEALDIVKKAAQEYGWDPNLTWVNHGIRHGACLDAADASADQSVAGRAGAAQQRCAQKSLNVINTTYLKTEQARELVAKAVKNDSAWKLLEIDGFVVRRLKKSFRVSSLTPAAVAGGKKTNRRKVAVLTERRSAQLKKGKSEGGSLNLEAASDIILGLTSKSPATNATTTPRVKRKYVRRKPLGTVERPPAEEIKHD